MTGPLTIYTVRRLAVGVTATFLVVAGGMIGGNRHDLAPTSTTMTTTESSLFAPQTPPAAVPATTEPTTPPPPMRVAATSSTRTIRTAPASRQSRSVVATPFSRVNETVFLGCLAAHESVNAGGYKAVNATETAFGRYQLLQATADSTAKHIGRLDLVGVRPDRMSPGDQDLLAWALYGWVGPSPWPSGAYCARQAAR